MQWYYSKNGAQNGPISFEELKTKIESKEVGPRDLVWKDGMADWVPAGEVADLRPAFGVPVAAQPAPAASAPAAEAVAPAAAQAPVPGYQTQERPLQPGYAQAPATYGAPVAPPAQGMAIASMVCGIVSLVICCAWYFSGPIAIVAIVMGHISLSRIKSQPAQYAGKGKAKAGVITGYIGLLLALIVAVCAIFAMTLTPEKLEQMEFLPKEMREQIRKDMEKKRSSRELIPDQP